MPRLAGPPPRAATPPDTQLLRLGGPNFHEIPINAPIVQVHNNQRDGFHRQAIFRGRVAYEPNSLAGGCPFQAGGQGFVSVAARDEARQGTAKVRAKPEKFAEHYAQTRLFLNSQTPAEQEHIAAAFRFELSKCTVPAVRERMVASLRNVSDGFAAKVAAGLGIDPLPAPLPLAVRNPPAPEVTRSSYLSLLARPGDGSIAGRKVAILVGPGVAGGFARRVQQTLLDGGAVGRFVGLHIGAVAAADGTALDADASMENAPGYLFDALVIPHGVQELARDAHLWEFVRDVYRHCKPLLAIGSACELVARILPEGAAAQADKALILEQRQEEESAQESAIERLVSCLGAPRDFSREGAAR